MKMKIPEAVIDVDWDYLKENHAAFSKQAEWMWGQLMRISFQKAIYDFRMKWGIPPRSGFKDKKGAVSEAFGGMVLITGSIKRDIETNEGIVRIEDAFKEVLKKFGIPEEYQTHLLQFAIFGTIRPESKTIGNIRTDRLRQAQVRNRNRESQYKKWDDIVNMQNLFPDHELSIGGVTLNIDPSTGWIIIKQDPSRPTSEINKIFPLINDFKKKSNEYFGNVKVQGSGAAKTDYGLLVDLIIREIIIRDPSLENEMILTRAKVEFSNWEPDVNIEKVKELPLLVDAKFTKRVQRIRKDCAS